MLDAENQTSMQHKKTPREKFYIVGKKGSPVFTPFLV